MPFYIVRFEHPDAAGWQREVGAHVAWLRERVADGSVRASGPLTGAADRAAMLVMVAADRVGTRRDHRHRSVRNSRLDREYDSVGMGSDIRCVASGVIDAGIGWLTIRP